jgi:hypothetical protein
MERIVGLFEKDALAAIAPLGDVRGRPGTTMRAMRVMAKPWRRMAIW